MGFQENEDRIKVGNGFCKEVTNIFMKKCLCGISMDYQTENEFFEEMDIVKQTEKVLFRKWSGFLRGKKLICSTYKVGPQKDVNRIEVGDVSNMRSALCLNIQIMESV